MSDVTLAELDRKLDAIHNSIKSQQRDHEDRIRRIERWMFGIPASLTVAALMVLDRITSGAGS